MPLDGWNPKCPQGPLGLCSPPSFQGHSQEARFLPVGGGTGPLSFSPHLSVRFGRREGNGGVSLTFFPFRSVGEFPVDRLHYAEFFEELWERMGLELSQVADMVNKKWPHGTVCASQLHEFLKGRGCPRASFTKAIEMTFNVSLPPYDYGYGEVHKP